MSADGLFAGVAACGFAPFAARWRGPALTLAEVERIRLPFTVWLVVLVPDRRRAWPAARAVTALAVNHLLSTNW